MGHPTAADSGSESPCTAINRGSTFLCTTASSTLYSLLLCRDFEKKHAHSSLTVTGTGRSVATIVHLRSSVLRL